VTGEVKGRLSIGRGLKRLTWVLSLLPPLATVVFVVAVVGLAAWSGGLYVPIKLSPDRVDIRADPDSLGESRYGAAAGADYRIKINGKTYKMTLDRPADSREELLGLVREELRKGGLPEALETGTFQILNDSVREILLFFTLMSGAWFVVCWTVYFTARWVARGFTPPPD
jgi:hypothetical protein